MEVVGREVIVRTIVTLLGFTLLTAAPASASTAGGGSEASSGDFSAARGLAKRQRGGGIALGTLSALSFAGVVATGLSWAFVEDDTPHGTLSMGLMLGATALTGITIGTAAGAGKLLGRSDGVLDRLQRRGRRDHRTLTLAGIGLTVIGGVSGTAIGLAFLTTEPGAMPDYTLTISQLSFAGLCGAGLGMISYGIDYARALRLQPIAGRDVWGVSAMGRF